MKTYCYMTITWISYFLRIEVKIERVENMKNVIRKITDGLVNDVNNRVFYYFRRISQIPRGSHNEQAIADWLVDFAKLYGFKHTRSTEIIDGLQTHNVVIFKPATLGYENCKPVILQGHMDMVCTQTADSTHDFKTDPIKILEYIDEEGRSIMTADRTTLGGDNGIGCAFALAILERDDLPHPEIRALFTSDEEAGMSGAQAVTAALLGITQEQVKNKDYPVLVNVDTEEEGSLYNACAGGLYANFELQYNQQKLSSNLIEIKISGLRGGHSGIDIHRGRANAYILMAGILHDITTNCSGANMQIATITGSEMRNAIAMECSVVIAVGCGASEVVKIVEAHRADFKEKFVNTEPVETVVMEATALPQGEFSNALPAEETSSFVKTLKALPNGVYEMYGEDDPNYGLVKTSSSIGRVVQESGIISFCSFIRSFERSEKESLRDKMEEIAKAANIAFSINGDMPSWKPNPSSELLKRFKASYRFIFGVTPGVKSIHAGLECGFFAENFPGMDIISCGPTLIDVHTPDEIMHTDTVVKITELLLVALWQMNGEV